MNIKKLSLKQHWPYLALLVLLVSITGNFVQCGKGRSYREELRVLAAANETLNETIANAEEKEDKLQQEIDRHKAESEKAGATLNEKLKEIAVLKARVDSQRKPGPEPEVFRRLEECQEKYDRLHGDHQVTLDWGREQENGLKLCLDSKERLTRLFNLQEAQYINLQIKAGALEKKVENHRTALEAYQRKMKRSLFRGKVRSFFWGTVSVTAVYFILRALR